MNREKQRLNQTRPPPSKKPLISEGRDVLTKASTGQKAAGLPMYHRRNNGGQLNMGMKDSIQASSTGDWDNRGVTYQAEALKSVKGTWKGKGKVEDLVSQWPRLTGHHC